MAELDQYGLISGSVNRA